MKNSQVHTPSRRVWVVVGTTTFLAALAGCTGEQTEREYAIPQSACGTRINAEELANFLPPGKKLSIKTTSKSENVVKCAISVDGKLIVQTSQEWWNDMSVIEFARGMTLENPEHRTDDGKYAYSGYQAFSKMTDCQRKDQVLYAAVQASGSEHRDAEAMKKIITDYTRAVEESRACN
ncbi:hypothetical protein SSP24_40380 [Streptomyces spinoverrucosus]|uniref:Lipoprotein n=1 Tax=Streptomyces spinoverrucosus TaxID=284043 RepID=A0A4Y3VIL8_9ACTN|nr:hypothetical protein [Streptomyces spinoverrucosus]GEC06383.1 hypothetical protein SSP24_40380 [Streptomyces spinoverrucosus]GHB86976.1 hypothetical protein GCM10010397_68270 [Streptomyces spinoverrucosus]